GREEGPLRVLAGDLAVAVDPDGGGDGGAREAGIGEGLRDHGSQTREAREVVTEVDRSLDQEAGRRVDADAHVAVGPYGCVDVDRGAPGREAHLADTAAALPGGGVGDVPPDGGRERGVARVGERQVLLEAAP